MSAGTPRTIVRIPPILMEEVEEAITRRNWFSREAPWTVSDFLRIAVREKLRKMERCRQRKRKTPSVAAAIAAAEMRQDVH